MLRITTAPFTLAVALFASAAHAGDGSKPASITVDLEALQGDLTDVTFVDGASTPTPVISLASTHPSNPEGVAIIRGGNHSITKGTGASVRLKRAVAGQAGEVFVTYVHDTGHLLIPRVRKVAGDNATAFDVSYTGNALAGVAPDGDGGVFVANQIESTANGGHQLVQSRVVFRRYSESGALLWQTETPNWPYPDDDSGPPEGPASRWVTAVATADGVTVGYAHTDGTLPGIERRNAADGSLVFRAVGLKKAAPNVRFAAPGKPGAVGTVPLAGRVHTLVAAADGSVIATIDGQVIRVDSTGKQTHAYACSNGRADGARIRCGTAAEGKEYGVVDGQLTVVRTTQTELPAGWTMGVAVPLGNGRWLRSGKTSQGKLAVALVGADGSLLATKIANASAGEYAVLGGGAGKWFLYVPGEPKWTRLQGTYSAGGNPGAQTPGAIPAASPAVQRGH